MIDKQGWTNWADIPGSDELVDAQVRLLDAYEALLDSRPWDVAELNDVAKSALITYLSMLKVQTAMCDDIVRMQKEMIDQYRESLLEVSRRRDGSAD